MKLSITADDMSRINAELIINHDRLRRELWKDAFIAYFNHKQDTIAAITHADRVTCTFDQRFNPTNEKAANDN